MDEREKIYIETKYVSKNPVRDVYNKMSEIPNIENLFITNMNFEK